MAEIEAICAIADPVVRNLRITQAYAEMSSALEARVGPGANWCTFATWASKQAGQTIRIEDLARTVEGHLGRSDALTHVIERLTAFVRAIDRGEQRDRATPHRADREGLGSGRAGRDRERAPRGAAPSARDDR